jgi:hypothetical protein
MKRDMELIRQILLAVEANPSADPFSTKEVAVDGYNPDVVMFHILLLDQAGLLKGIDASSNDGPDFIVQSISWGGYEFLDTVRDPAVWRRTKSAVEKVGSASIDVIASVAKGVAAQVIQQSLGMTGG